jgi:tetratricopeptide (TPR) repeat protein
MKKTTPFLPIIILITLFACSQPCFAQFSAESKKLAAQYRDKGLEAQKGGDFDTALVYFQKAMELDPSLAVAYNDAGVIYEAKGWNDRAKQAYGRAIELDPSLASPYYNLGSIYEKEGDFEKSVYYFKKRVLIGDWNDQWTMKARRELKGLGVSDPEVREDFMNQHLASLESTSDINGVPRGNDLDPKKRKRDARLHLFRGKQLYYMGQYNEALSEVGLAEVLDPQNKEIRKLFEEINRKVLMND